MPELFVSLQVHKQGELIYDMPMRPSHSWVRNAQTCWIANQVSYGGTSGGYTDGYLSKKNMVGTIGTISYSITYAVLGLINSSAYGIVVGTGTGAESYEDFALGTLITSGTSTGQLTYQAQSACTEGWTGGVVTLTHTRVMNNNSGGSITVNEVGWYTSVCMWCRDKLGTGVTVPDTGQLTVNYAITMDTSP